MLRQLLRIELRQSPQGIATVANAHEARLTALETRERTPSRRENVTAERDVYTATKQVCGEANFITQWLDSFDPLDEVTEATFSAWVWRKGQNVLDIQWALKQFNSVFTRGNGIIRGAITLHELDP